MTRTLSNFKIRRGVSLDQIDAKKIEYKRNVNKVEADNKRNNTKSTAKFDTFDILPDAGKVIISRSSSDDVIVEDLKNYPLGRQHRHLIYDITIHFVNDGTIANMSAAVDIATAVANNLTEKTGKIVVVTVIDDAFHSSTKTVLPSVFAQSTYIQHVEHVVTGNAENGALLMPEEYKTLTMNECGRIESEGDPEPDPKGDGKGDGKGDPEPEPEPDEDEESDGAVF